jgi:hypothetical protein
MVIYYFVDGKVSRVVEIFKDNVEHIAILTEKLKP